tara:strand:- start:137 stop:337 length:201 start_codon:yes stop_codon:yes gene_type:complete
MGCGCKKKKSQQGLTSAAVRSGNSNEGNINEANLKEVENSRAYQNKVRDALKQLMELKKRKRKLNQ